MKEKRCVLVTGATGFLGTHLILFLQKQEDLCVFGVSKNGGQVDNVRIDRVDLTSTTEVAAWHSGKPIFDAFFHLAAIVPVSFYSTEAEQSFFANLYVTQNMLKLAISDRASFIYASSSSVYGVSEDVPITEDSMPRPDNAYSLSKYVGELMCSVAHARCGIPTTTLRITAPYGPFQTTRTVINRFLQAALESRDLTLYGSGNRIQDFTYVSDVVQALWLAYKRKKTGVYNIAGGQPVTMNQLADIVLSVVPGTKSKISYLGRVDPQEAYRGIFAIDKARHDLGYEPRTSLSDGLRACLAAMKQRKK